MSLVHHVLCSMPAVVRCVRPPLQTSGAASSGRPKQPSRMPSRSCVPSQFRFQLFRSSTSSRVLSSSGMSLTLSCRSAFWLTRCSLLQIKRMEMEARSFSPDRSRVLLQKVKEYKADLAALRVDAKKVSTSSAPGAAARAELGLEVKFIDSQMLRSYPFCSDVKLPDYSRCAALIGC